MPSSSTIPVLICFPFFSWAIAPNGGVFPSLVVSLNKMLLPFLASNFTLTIAPRDGITCFFILARAISSGIPLSLIKMVFF